jgi:hypothetical protein
MSSPVYAVVAVSVVYLIPACVEAQSLASVPQPSAAIAQPDPTVLDPITSPTDSATPATPSSALDEPIEQIAGTSNGCAVLDKDFPGLRKHPMYGFFKSMSLHQIAAMSRGKITPDMLTQAQTDLAAMPAAATTPVAAASAAPTPVAATPVASVH